MPEISREAERVAISFGAFLPTIAEQLAEQGFACDRAEAYEADRLAINRLRFSGCITESEAHKAFKRLLAGIVRNLCRPHASSAVLPQDQDPAPSGSGEA